MQSDSFFADAKAQIQQQSFQRYLVPRFTSYRPVTDDKQSFTALSQSLAESEIRNNLIIEDVLNVVAAGRTPIILTARTSHVELLAEMLKQHVANIIQLTGEGTAKNKRETLQKLQDIPKDAPLVIVATGKYVGEDLTIHDLIHCFWHYQSHGKDWWHNMPDVCTVRMRARKMFVFMTILIYTNLFVRICIVNA